LIGWTSGNETFCLRFSRGIDGPAGDRINLRKKLFRRPLLFLLFLPDRRGKETFYIPLLNCLAYIELSIKSPALLSDGASCAPVIFTQSLHLLYPDVKVAYYHITHLTIHFIKKGRCQMMGMRNVGFVVLCLVVLGSVAAYAETGDMMGKDKMMATDDKMAMDNGMSKDGIMEKKMEMEMRMQAMLMGSKGHHAAGKVSIGSGMNNAHVLTLSHIKVDKVPDGYVYLARDGDWKNGVLVGMLKQFTGTVSFDLPAGVNPDDYNSLVIWCKKFNVEIGRATFGKKLM
jgi:hypothetical protein